MTYYIYGALLLALWAVMLWVRPRKIPGVILLVLFMLYTPLFKHLVLRIYPFQQLLGFYWSLLAPLTLILLLISLFKGESKKYLILSFLYICVATFMHPKGPRAVIQPTIFQFVRLTTPLEHRLLFSDKADPKYAFKYSEFFHPAIYELKKLELQEQEELFPKVQQGLKHSRPIVRERAAIVLGHWGFHPETFVPELVHVLRTERFINVRTFVGDSLSKNVKLAVPGLIEILNDQTLAWENRVKAAQILIYSRPPYPGPHSDAVMNALIQALKDPSSEFRWRVALHNSGWNKRWPRPMTDKLVNAMALLLDYWDKRHQRAAKEALKRIKTPAALKALRAHGIEVQ